MSVNFSELVTTRLAANGLELGLKRTWATAPKRKFIREDSPCAYTLIGGTFSPTVKSKGKVSVYRNYVQRFLLMPFAGGIEDLQGGAESNLLTLQWIDKIAFYYHEHDRLSTAELAPLRYCEGVLAVSDPGLVLRKAPGGLQFAAIEITLSILMAAMAEVIAIPYED